MASDSDSDSRVEDLSSDGEEDEDESTEAPQEEKVNIREKLSTMSFEDLQKLKEKMGSKLYNKTVFGVDTTKPKVQFKRANKNRPREVSSKRKVGLDKSIPGKKQIPRDPRFDPLCGTFDRKTFKSNYKFVNDLRKKEKTELGKKLKTGVGADEKEKIKYVVQRLDNQIREDESVFKRKEKELEEKRQIRDKLKRGEKPQFKKKSVKRLEDLVGKYEELKKTNKLQKHIEKRTKKLSCKERRNNILPFDN